MRKPIVLAGPAVLALLLAGCGDNHDAAVQALKDNETQWNKDFAAKSVDKLAAHYADHAVLMSPGMPSSTGKDAIRKTLTGMVADPSLNLQFHSAMVEVSKSGDMGFTQGSYTMTMTDPNTRRVINDHGSYVTTYIRQADGSWKAVADIATSEVPAPVPPAEPMKAAKAVKTRKKGPRGH